MNEQLTPEQIEAYRQQLAAHEQAAMSNCVAALQALAAERGFVISARVRLLSDGRLSADWGVVPKGHP